jgi:hypothetical protein
MGPNDSNIWRSLPSSQTLRKKGQIMDCACTVEMDIGDRVEMIASYPIKKCRATHICDECQRTVKQGEWYFRETFWHEAVIETHKTCEDCYSLRQVFFSSGWCFGNIWLDMKYTIQDSDGDISVTCILELTKPARDKVLDMIEDTWNE